MIYSSNNFDGKVIDEANYQVYGKDNTIGLYNNKTTLSVTEKFVTTMGLLYKLKPNEQYVYYSILSTLRHFYTKGIYTRIIKFDKTFFINIEAKFGINHRTAKTVISNLCERGILKPIFAHNKKQYFDRAELNDKYTPDNIIKNNVECIVIKL